MIATPGTELASLRGMWVQLLELGTKTVSNLEDMVLCEMSQLKKANVTVQFLLEMSKPWVQK